MADNTVKCPFCKGVNAAECTHCKGRGTFEIKFASTESVEYLGTFTDMVMEQIYQTTGIEGAWISDMSSIGDFIDDDTQLAALSEALGIEVDYQQTIVEVAKRLRDV